jgi:hypothetical protein
MTPKEDTMATMTTEKAKAPPNSLPVDVMEEVRRALNDSRFGEILDSRIAEQVKPIERQLANITVTLEALAKAVAASSTAASSTPPAPAPITAPAPAGNGTPPVAASLANAGISKLEIEPRSPEPAFYAERQLPPLDEWNVFDPKDPTTFIAKSNQGTINP